MSQKKHARTDIVSQVAERQILEELRALRPSEARYYTGIADLVAKTLGLLSHKAVEEDKEDAFNELLEDYTREFIRLGFERMLSNELLNRVPDEKKDAWRAEREREAVPRRIS